MMNPKRYIPHVEEGQLVEQTLAVGALTVVISDIPSIHASRIDVSIESASLAGVGNDLLVVLRLYGASQQNQVDVTLGTTTEGTTDGYTYSQYIGQSFDLMLQNTDGQGTADAATYTAWVGARP